MATQDFAFKSDPLLRNLAELDRLSQLSGLARETRPAESLRSNQNVPQYTLDSIPNQRSSLQESVLTGVPLPSRSDWASEFQSGESSRFPNHSADLSESEANVLKVITNQVSNLEPVMLNLADLLDRRGIDDVDLYSNPYEIIRTYGLDERQIDQLPTIDTSDLRQRLERFHQSINPLTRLVASNLLEVLPSRSLSIVYRTIEKVITHLEQKGPRETLDWLLYEYDVMLPGIPYDQVERPDEFRLNCDPEVRNFFLNGPFMSFIQEANQAFKERRPIQFDIRPDLALKVLQMVLLNGDSLEEFQTKIASARSVDDLRQYVNSFPVTRSSYEIYGGFPVFSYEHGSVDSIFVPYIEKYSRMSKQQIEAIYYNDNLYRPMSIVEQAIIRYYGGIDQRRQLNEFSLIDFKILQQLKNNPKTAQLASRLSNSILLYGIQSQLGFRYHDLIRQLDKSSGPELADYLLSLLETRQPVSQYRDVVKSREFLSVYKKFLENPTQRLSDHLVYMLNSMSVLIAPELLTVLPGYDELNSRLGNIPKVMTPSNVSRF